ncbi:unnamed protein product [Thelazia callipaeda]|uniref:CSN8_PSD8_EIF3K domain-containing protein n=1 Tax=Thelazia callipaeda TaxID=103827 RepID=A0A0N5CL49_THECL|nr:unnamed protein product [Thelazia callipaeda]
MHNVCIVQASSPLIMKLKSFENRELQPNENDVDVDFFSQLLIFYMIKEDWTKARQCRLRAEASVTNAKMNTLLLICRHLEECNTGAALHLIKNASFDCPIKDLIMELEKGIMLSILRMVEHVYLNIEAVKLAEMFDAESNDELQKILDEVGWVQEDGYVIPKMTSELKTKLSELDPLHQGRVSPTFSSVNKKKVKEPVDINKLVEYATFLEVDT